MKLIILLIIVLISIVNCQQPQQQQYSILTPNEKVIIQNYHNKLRTNPTGPIPSSPIPLLTYNETIAANLSIDLGKCNGCKKSNMTLSGQNSENQAWWVPGNYFDVQVALDHLGHGATMYDWNAKSCNYSNPYYVFCIHWTNAVWAKSTSYGCTKLKCSDKLIWACSYYPAGGFRGVLPYLPQGQTLPPTPTPTQTQTQTPTQTPTKTPTPTPTQTQTQTPTPTPTQTQTQTPTPTPTQTQTQTPTPVPTTPVPITQAPVTTPAPTTAAPTITSVDWTDYLTPVRNQGMCGSCWSFGATAALESRYLIKYGTAEKSTLSLSNQNAVNCIANGCRGGWSSNVFNFFKGPGIAFEKDDPYGMANYSNCITTSEVPRFKYVDFGYAAKTKVALINELKKGPISVALWVDDAFKAYKTGIFNSQTVYNSVNHIVLLVGYDLPTDSWKIKNSWSANWGDGGFMRFTAANDNLGMLLYNSYYPTF